MEFQNAIALTGGIATGKSSVCALLQLYGFKIIDADKIAHSVLDQNSGKIADMFGSEFVAGEKVDRKRLGAVIFSDEAARIELEALLHPLIKAQILHESSLCEEKKIPYIVDIPLFYEKGNYSIDEVAVVYCTPEQQIQRLIERESYTPEEAKNRIAVQMPIGEKREKASFVIDNTQNLKHLQHEVDRFTGYIREKYPHIKL
ncbi:MAG: dephospho-CoA kinase [Sulfurospirillum sp.]|nr:MAG: dephospho-CoA kinase [Sulfurospirillum sp.]